MGIFQPLAFQHPLVDPHLWLNRLRRLQSHLRKIDNFLVAAVNTTAKLGVSRISMFYNKKMSKRLDVLFENNCYIHTKKFRCLSKLFRLGQPVLEKPAFGRFKEDTTTRQHAVKPRVTTERHPFFMPVDLHFPVHDPVESESVLLSFSKGMESISIPDPET